MEGEDYEHITPEDLTSVDMNVRDDTKRSYLFVCDRHLY